MISKIDVYASNMIIGIDPGKSGGMAIIKWGNTVKNTKICTAFKCPQTIDEMSSFIKMLQKDAAYITCYLENVHAFPTDGRSSAFKFGVNFGVWQGILSSFDIKTELVTPRTWQSAYGKLPKIKKDRKNMIKEIATKETGIKSTLATADAICIALYGYNIKKESHGKWGVK
tara:strand:- start:16728 stop:17240 length:513 start_codon:yes stop_codon:yes gene_type:complete